jgi:hypothetical protein
MTAPDAIPPNLAEAFRDALLFYRTSWTPAAHGPEVSIKGRAFTITAVCHLVSEFADELPQNILPYLLDRMDLRYANLKEELVTHPTYKTAALCLAKLIRDSTTEYERTEALRRGDS